MLQSVYSFITEHCQRHTMLFNEKKKKKIQNVTQNLYTREKIL